MRVLKYFYENYVMEIVDGLVEFSGCVLDGVLTVLSWLFAACLFITLPLWIIPYKVWDRKNRERMLNILKKEVEGVAE